jgi:hypothetical protein
MKYLVLTVLILAGCGKDGSNGIPGPAGQPGTPGTQVTEIQLCPGTPTYPSTFVEFAQCVNGNLYAVYSANDGFWTYLPPGTYSSNAIGSSCNFQVLSNCQVVPQ